MNERKRLRFVGLEDISDGSPNVLVKNLNKDLEKQREKWREGPTDISGYRLEPVEDGTKPSDEVASYDYEWGVKFLEELEEESLGSYESLTSRHEPVGQSTPYTGTNNTRILSYVGNASDLIDGDLDLSSVSEELPPDESCDESCIAGSLERIPSLNEDSIEDVEGYCGDILVDIVNQLETTEDTTTSAGGGQQSVISDNVDAVKVGEDSDISDSPLVVSDLRHSSTSDDVPSDLSSPMDHVNDIDDNVAEDILKSIPQDTELIDLGGKVFEALDCEGTTPKIVDTRRSR